MALKGNSPAVSARGSVLSSIRMETAFSWIPIPEPARFMQPVLFSAVLGHFGTQMFVPPEPGAKRPDLALDATKESYTRSARFRNL
jgi:hypothetical protein